MRVCKCTRASVCVCVHFIGELAAIGIFVQIRIGSLTGGGGGGLQPHGLISGPAEWSLHFSPHLSPCPPCSCAGTTHITIPEALASMFHYISNSMILHSWGYRYRHKQS